MSAVQIRLSNLDCLLENITGYQKCQKPGSYLSSQKEACKNTGKNHPLLQPWASQVLSEFRPRTCSLKLCWLRPHFLLHPEQTWLLMLVLVSRCLIVPSVHFQIREPSDKDQAGFVSGLARTRFQGSCLYVEGICKSWVYFVPICVKMAS